MNSSDLLNKLEEKEQFEMYSMVNQHRMASATLDEAFAQWKKDQLQRRKRFIQTNGIQATLERGYHIPFWQWWMNKLSSEHSNE